MKFSIILSLLTAFVFALVGCENPDVSVSQMSRQMPAPQLKGTSPFDQDVDTTGYVQMQGTCDVRLAELSLSLDNGVTWHQPLQSETINSVTKTNDFDCSDGNFNFYITKATLESWGIDTANNDVTAVYLKGSTLIGDSQIAIIYNTDDGNGTPAVATNIVLKQGDPQGLGGSDQCTYFYVSLQDAAGRNAVSSTAQSFGLNLVSTNSGDALKAYTTWSDCNSDATSQSSFTIPAGDNGMSVIIRFPTNVTSIVKYNLTNSSLTMSGIPTISLRDSSASSIYRYVLGRMDTTNIYKDQCYPFKFTAYNYSNVQTEDTEDITVNVGALGLPTGTALAFYSDSTCATTTSSVVIPTGSLSSVAYVKYTSASGDATTYLDLTLNFAASVVSGAHTYDIASTELWVDRSSNSIATRIDLWGPNSVATGQCSNFMVVPTNRDGAQLPVTTSILVTLGVTEGTNIAAFYSDSSCTNAITSTYLSAGLTMSQVYFRVPSGSTATSVNITTTATGMTSVSRAISVQQ
jgi:hypothetical protein